MSPTFEPTPGKILGTMPRTIQGVREECLDATGPLDPSCLLWARRGSQVDQWRPWYVWYGQVAAIHLLAGVGASVPLTKMLDALLN